jgi:hypothetical protein
MEVLSQKVAILVTNETISYEDTTAVDKEASGDCGKMDLLHNFDFTTKLKQRKLQINV